MGFLMPILGLWRRFSALGIAFCSTAALAQFYPPPSATYSQPMIPYANPGTSAALQSQASLLAGRGSDSSRSTQLWPSSISYTRETNFMNFNVGNDLSFGVDYTYSFTFSLGARRSDGEESKVPNGWYKLNMAVVLKESENLFRPAMGLRQATPYDRYVTSVSMFVKVTGGRFNRSVRLSFPNVTSTTLINHLYVELIPLRKDCRDPKGRGIIPCIQMTADGRQPEPARSLIEPLPGVTPYLIEMPFVPYLPNGRSDRNPDDAPESISLFLTQSLSQYIAAARLYQQRLRPEVEALDAREYAKRSRLHYLTINDAAFQKALRAWLPNEEASTQLKTIFNQEGLGTLALSDDLKKLMPVFCDLLFEHNQQYQASVARSPIKIVTQKAVQGRIRQCGVEPTEYLSLSRVTHIHKVNLQRPAERIFSRGTSFNLMANFMVNRVRSEDFTVGWTIKPQVVFLQALEAFGFTIPPVLDWSYSISTMYGRSTSENMIGSLLTSLDFNVNAMSIPIASGASCLLVAPKKDSTFIDSREGASNGLYICEDEKRDFKVQEFYAHIFERGRETSTVDSFDPASQSINIGLRGDRDVSTFFYLIRKNITPKHESKVFPFRTLEKAERHFANTPQSLPRMVVQPLTFEREEIPSFLQKAFGAYSEAFIGD